MRDLDIPVTPEMVDDLSVGEIVMIRGEIFAGRDAALPKLVEIVNRGSESLGGVRFDGGAVFHTAVSPAGVGPTSSNKVEIEESIGPLSAAGIRVHMGKGELREETVRQLKENHSCFVVVPPTTALLGSKTKSKKVVAFSELGMEALHCLEVDGYPAVVASVNGESLWEGRADA